jgi:filamentous hemagglutinin family protein
MMHQLRHSLLLTTAAVALLGATLAHANPDGPNVVGGAATVGGLGTSSVIVNQHTDRAIIDWRTFNIGNGELTRFSQPSSGSVILNRVTGGLGPSQILGTIQANGKVFLVNRDGILFGPNSMVNTAGFLATTNDIKNDDFMNGQGRFVFGTPGRPDASIVNLGTITAGDAGFAALVAPGVRNSGTITANVGSVGLASGNGFTLDFYGDKLITLQVGDQIASSVKDVATGQTLDALVKNTGKLSANGGRVELSAVTARQVVDSVINNTGVIEANTVGLKGGQIILGAQTSSTKVAGAPAQNVKVSGTLSAAGKDAGSKGGKVKITGENIALTSANIDASGKAGGGKVLIGGDVGGGKGTPHSSRPQASLENEAVPNASNLSVDATTVIDVSAKDSGDAGKVALWSDGATTFYGTIRATGGISGGNGGFVEVSGYQNLAFNGLVDLRAPNGTRGQLLLDPQDVSIGGTGTWVISVLALENALSLGDVFVTSSGAGNGSGDIIVAESFSWSNHSVLTLAAYRDIVINHGVTITHTGSGTLNLGAGITYLGGASWFGNGDGTIRFNGTGKIDFSQGSGLVQFGYNSETSTSAHKYTSPTDFSAHVHTSPNHFTAYMWVNDVFDLQDINQNLSGTYAIANKIDASITAFTNFTPIGDSTNPFTGTLIGVGAGDILMNGPLSATIDRLTIKSSAANVGLFGVIGVGGIVDDIGLTNVTIVANGSNQFVGTIAGTNQGLIAHVSAAGSLGSEDNATPVSSAIGAYGGLVGLNDIGGSIANSRANVAIEVTGPISGYIDAGGLVGQNRGRIMGSSAAGTIHATYGSNARTYLGGLVGWNLGSSYFTGSGSISNSYATVDITGSGSFGVGGGLVGQNDTGSIIKSYSTGSVQLAGLSNTAGGLVGGTYSGTASNSYWDITTSGLTTSALGTGLTTAQLASGTLPSGFTSPWLANPNVNNGYPYLPTSFPIIASGNNPTIFGSPSGPITTSDIIDALLDRVYDYLLNELDNYAKTGTLDPFAEAIINEVIAAVDPAGPAGNQSPAGNGPRGNANRPGDPASTAGIRGLNRPPLDKLPSGVPPVTETRYVSNEVTLEIEQTVPRDRVEAIARQLGLNVLGTQDFNLAGTSMFRFRLPTGRTVTDVIRAMEAGGNKVGAAQPNYVYGLTQTAAPDLPSAQDLSSSQDLSADPASRATGVAGPSSLQYSLSKLRLSEAHRVARGEQIVVAVIDSEVDRSHPDLKAVKFEAFDALGGNLAEPHAHGTSMTGAIASRGRILGVAPGVNVLAIKAFGSAGGNTFEIIKGLDWAAANGAKIVNMSFAGPPDPMLSRALAVARRKGMVLIAAAGNAGPKSPPLFPAADPNVIAVTATDLDDKVFPGANRGKYIAVAAPGVDVLALSPGGRYEMSTGTSIATAHVSGLAALLLQRNPTLGHEGIRRILMSTAKDLGPKGIDPDYGAGLVDAYGALNAAAREAPDVTSSIRTQ